LWFIGLFDKKISLFVNGRKTVFETLANNISKGDKVIWFHCASLGEFEQGRPILENVHQKFPKHKILLTFFSPSGYEPKKNFAGADVVTYLPLDTKSNAQRFLDVTQPELVIFVKYEFWPNILKALKKRQIKTLLVSAIFRKEQPFFNFFGKWMQKPLQTFTYFFVQDQNSKKLLKSIHFNNVTVSGDTRFDRVTQIKTQAHSLVFIEQFKNNQYTLVAGSTWKEDEANLVNYINNKATLKEKFIIAPHNINATAILELKKSIIKKTVLFSKMKEKDLSKATVFILDTIGLLSKVYAYANVVYVGGGYTKSGVHNILEPAVFGVPLLIGPEYSKFKEVKDLVALKAISVTHSKKEVAQVLESLFKNKSLRESQGKKAFKYVKQHQGGTQKISSYIIKIMK